MLGLALELRERGHEVIFATNPYYEQMTRSHGLPFEPLGTVENFQAVMKSPDLWNPRRAFGLILRHLQHALKLQYDVHAAYAKSAAVSVTNCLGMGALVAQDKLGLPAITMHLQPGVIWSDRKPPKMPGMFGPGWFRSIQYRIGERFFIAPIVCPFLNQWRDELGLPPVRRITQWWNSRSGVICMFPEWYAERQSDWPPNLIQTDFPLWNNQSSAGLPDDVARFLDAGDPPLVFTPGSTNIHASAFFVSAVAACQTLGRRGILLSEFPEQIPSPLPEGVAHFRYVPIDLRWPGGAAFVHHGGIGSASQAMLAGAVQLIMPLAHDQFDNSERIKRMGLGDWLGVKKFTGDRVAERLDKLLSSSQAANACRDAAVRLAGRDGLSRSAAAVEEFARRGVPDGSAVA